MKAVSLLQVIYSFFLGLVVLGLVAIGINTFLPSPRWEDYGSMDRGDDGGLAFQAAQNQWSLTASIVLLVCATIILAVSLIRPGSMAVISNGLLLGGIFTMIYAVGLSLSGESSVTRFLVALAALLITVGVGYLTFVRRKATAASGAGAGTGTAAELAERVDALERRLDALGRALRDDG
ncbi:MAG: hypothetical protein ACLGHZ_07855 [Actinomycetes bacterium]